MKLGLSIIIGLGIFIVFIAIYLYASEINFSDLESSAIHIGIAIGVGILAFIVSYISLSIAEQKGELKNIKGQRYAEKERQEMQSLDKEFLDEE